MILYKEGTGWEAFDRALRMTLDQGEPSAGVRQALLRAAAEFNRQAQASTTALSGAGRLSAGPTGESRVSLVEMSSSAWRTARLIS